MKVLVTGANGFIGKNLISRLEILKDVTILPYDIGVPDGILDKYCAECDFVFNLAGVNRPQEIEEYMNGNYGFASTLIDLLKKHYNISPIMNASSIQATLTNAYGRSKKAGEDLLFNYGHKMNLEIYNYRFANVFGKWCKPNYNSVVATFCYNIANNIPIQLNDSSIIMNLVYIDDVVDELVQALYANPHKDNEGYCFVPMVYRITLGDIASMLYSFKESRKNLEIPDVSGDEFQKKLYSTYLSYLPEDKFAYSLKMNKDDRGSFTEIFRTMDRGQVSINITKPGITKGNHWHHTKVEKFIVVSGNALIKFRQINSEKIVEYRVSGDKIEVVDIPPGYTHCIINEGKTELVTVMWCNERFDPDKPDTIYEEVERE